MRWVNCYYILLVFLISISMCRAQTIFPEHIRTQKNFKVVIFIGLECPISQKYMKKIEDMKAVYNEEVDFFAVVPEAVSAKQLDAFKSEYSSTLTFIEDHELKITLPLHAKVTPEVFLFGQTDQLIYRGAIDNWFYALGKYRREITAHYLKDAIEATQQGRKPKIEITEAVGCFIQLPTSDNQQHSHH